jgi:heme exporter protein D
MLDFDTGKYAVFIWSAYGLSAGVFAVLNVGAILHARRWKARFEALRSKADT